MPTGLVRCFIPIALPPPLVDSTHFVPIHGKAEPVSLGSASSRSAFGCLHPGGLMERRKIATMAYPAGHRYRLWIPLIFAAISGLELLRASVSQQQLNTGSCRTRPKQVSFGIIRKTLRCVADMPSPILRCVAILTVSPGAPVICGVIDQIPEHVVCTATIRGIRKTILHVSMDIAVATILPELNRPYVGTGTSLIHRGRVNKLVARTCLCQWDMAWTHAAKWCRCHSRCCH